MEKLPEAEAEANVRRICVENILSMLSRVRVSRENAERNLGAIEFYKLVEMHACLVHKGASRCSGCVTGHPSPPDAFALATMIAFGGPSRPASAAAHPYAVHPSSHNDLTPLRGYRGLIGFALLSMPPRRIKSINIVHHQNGKCYMYWR